MQTTGAAWEMTSLTQEPIFVALLAAAGTLPMFLFCFFAGILADRFERQRYIIVCQVWMMGVAATLAVLAWLGQLTHWNLLALAFCMGLGNAMNAPAWHAVVPEIVSGPLLRPAIALNSAGFNLARTVGPVLGQILLGLVGVFLLFAINACTYIGVIFAMASWRRPAEARASQRREGFLEAARTGIAYVQSSGELKAIFARGLCFFVPGKGIVGHAQLASIIEDSAKVVRHARRFSSVYRLASVALYERPILQALRADRPFAVPPPDVPLAGPCLAPIARQDFLALMNYRDAAEPFEGLRSATA
jgi:MFS family permease